MAVLIRDDFTGSGTLVGRVPDGGSAGGPWVDMEWAGALSNSLVGSGRLRRSGPSNSDGGYSPMIDLVAAPRDCYAQFRYLSGVTGGDSEIRVFMRARMVDIGFGPSLKYNYFALQRNSESELFIDSTLYDPVLSSVPVASSSDVIVRFELDGLVQRVFIDGVMVSEVTDTNDRLFTDGGSHFAFGDANYHSNPFQLEYIEFGTLGAPPPPPPFWTGYVLTSEVTAP